MDLATSDDNGITNTGCNSITLKVNPSADQMLTGGYVETCEVIRNCILANAASFNCTRYS